MLYDPAKEELFEVVGDPRDTRPGYGVSATQTLDNAAEANVDVRYEGRYGDFLMTCDVYKAGDQVCVHVYCPKCKHANKIESSQKGLYWDPRGGPSGDGVLSVDKFKCNWEMTDERDMTSANAGILIGSANMCGAEIVIDKNHARDADNGAARTVWRGL